MPRNTVASLASGHTTLGTVLLRANCWFALVFTIRGQESLKCSESSLQGGLPPESPSILKHFTLDQVSPTRTLSTCTSRATAIDCHLLTAARPLSSPPPLVNFNKKFHVNFWQILTDYAHSRHFLRIEVGPDFRLRISIRRVFNRIQQSSGRLLIAQLLHLLFCQYYGISKRNLPDECSSDISYLTFTTSTLDVPTHLLTSVGSGFLRGAFAFLSSRNPSWFLFTLISP